MRYVNIFTFNSLVFLSLGAIAASTSHLQDLIDVRASSGERQLEDRGYTYHKTIKVSSSSITYWWSEGREQCIAVTTKEGKYSSIVNQPEKMCEGASDDKHNESRDHHEHHSGHSGGLEGIVGARASSGEKQLTDMGYFERYSKKSGSSSITYWWSPSEQRCIAVTTKNGRYTSYNKQNKNLCDDKYVDSGKQHGGGAGLNSLVGMKASSGEKQLEDKGYKFIKSSKGEDRIWSNWWNSSHRKCITVVTLDGRYDSITDSPAFDCNHK